MCSTAAMVRGSGDDRLGVGAAGRDGFVVAFFARTLGALGQRMEVLVEGAGGHVALVEEVPRAPVRAGVLVALGQRRAGGVEHRVVGGADGPLEVPAGECLPGEDGAVARLIHELDRAWAHSRLLP
jgi:hypothetical protein